MAEVQNITGDELVYSLNTIILNHKISVIKEKFMDYKRTIDMTNIDIPEFCKPKDEQFEHLVDEFIKDIINGGTLDYYYEQALI